MEDTRPKFLNSVTEHPDVQRLIKQVVRGNCQNKKLQAELKAKDDVLQQCLNENFSGQTTLSPYLKRQIDQALKKGK